MSSAGGKGRARAGLRAVSDRIPLWGKLITAVLMLVLIALVVISVAGASVLKNYLLDQNDNTLQSYTGQADRYVAQYVQDGRTFPSTQAAVDWISGGSLDQVLQPVSGFHPSMGQPGDVPTVPGPQVPTSAAWLAANNGSALTGARPRRAGAIGAILVQSAQFQTANGSVVNGYIIVGVDVSSVYSAITHLAYLDLIVSAILLASSSSSGSRWSGPACGLSPTSSRPRPRLPPATCPAAYPTGIRGPRSGGSGGRSTRCWLRSRPRSGTAPGPRRRPGDQSGGCGSSWPTPATNCGPR